MNASGSFDDSYDVVVVGAGWRAFRRAPRERPRQGGFDRSRDLVLARFESQILVHSLQAMFVAVFVLVLVLK